jgi:hypothetical protein
MPRKADPYFAWVTLPANRAAYVATEPPICGSKTWDCGSNIGVTR